MAKPHAPASDAAFAAVLQWIAQAMAYRSNPSLHSEPNHRLITDYGLPSGSIRRGRVTRDNSDGSAIVELTFRKPKTKDELGHDEMSDGRCYRFDPESAALIRCLILFGSAIYEDAVEKGKFHDLQYGEEGRSILRIIAGAGVGEVVEENQEDHQDLRRSRISKRLNKSGKIDARKDAVRIARKVCEKNGDKAFLPLSADHYEWIICKLYDLIDVIPLKSPSNAGQ